MSTNWKSAGNKRYMVLTRDCITNFGAPFALLRNNCSSSAVLYILDRKGTETVECSPPRCFLSSSVGEMPEASPGNGFVAADLKKWTLLQGVGARLANKVSKVPTAILLYLTYTALNEEWRCAANRSG